MKLPLRLHIRIKPGNSVFQEWTFDNPKSVTIGFSSSASVWLFDPQAGSQDELFVRSRKEIRLRVLPSIEGSIEVEEKKISLQALRTAGLLRVDSKGEYIALQEKTTGNLILGKTPIQFWVTPSPKEPEFPAHPILMRLYRATPWGTFGIFLLVSILQYCLLKYIEGLPPPPPPSVEEMSRLYARFELPSSEYVAERFHTMEKSYSPDTTPNQEKEASKKHAGPLPSKTQGFLSAVAKGAPNSKNSQFSGLFTASSLSNEMEKALKSSGGFEKLTKEGLKNFGGGGGTGTSFGNSPETIGIGSIRQETKKEASLTKSTSVPLQSRFSYEGAAGGGTFDRNALEKLVESRTGELRDCYERAITRNPSLVGKIVVRLILRPTGNALLSIDDRSTLKDVSLHRCILDRMNSWPFQIPKQQTDPIALPFVFSPAAKG